MQGVGSGGDAEKILFIMDFAAVMFGCINGAHEIVKEAAIYRRERAMHLGIMPYLFSKVAVLINRVPPLCTLRLNSRGTLFIRMIVGQPTTILIWANQLAVCTVNRRL